MSVPSGAAALPTWVANNYVPPGEDLRSDISKTLTAGPKPMITANIYSPLPGPNYFRLIKICPGQITDPLHCKLEVAAIDDVIDSYEAISYVWGDPSITEPIVCNGVQLTITTNLAVALRSFRLSKTERVLWADAVCINQQDVEERSAQVKMMDQIYEKAKRVLTWLGPDTDGISKDCFELIVDTNQYLGDFYRPFEDGVNLLDPPPLRGPLRICQEGERWLHVRDLLKLPYFRRVWAVQEVGLAKECELWWGTGHTSMAHIFELVCWLHWDNGFGSALDRLSVSIHKERLYNMFLDVHTRYETKISWRFALPLIQWESFESLKESKWLFLMVLDTARFMKATDPRDLIYAFLGSPLAKKSNGGLIVNPDYSLSVEDVYFDTACALLENEREAPWLLGIVERRDLEGLLDRTSPSWVPLWNAPIRVFTFAHPAYWYTAGGTVRPFQPVVDRVSRTLHVTGCVFDTIAWTSEIIKKGNIRCNPYAWTESLRARGKPLIDLLWESISTFRAVDEDDFTLAMVQGYPSLQAGDIDIEQHKDDWSLYKQHVRAMIPEPDDKAIRNASVDARIVDVEKQMEGCTNRRLAVTKSGRVALVPGPTTRVGDVCCIIFGTTTPFVLTPEGAWKYRLVGACYMRGCMEGEIVSQVEMGVLKEETIVIA